MFQNLKRKSVYVVMSVIASLLFASVAVAQDAPNSADDLPGSGWWTGIQLQNVGTTTANVSINSYQSTAGVTPIGKSVNGCLAAGNDVSGCVQHAVAPGPESVQWLPGVRSCLL